MLQFAYSELNRILEKGDIPSERREVIQRMFEDYLYGFIPARRILQEVDAIEKQVNNPSPIDAWRKIHYPI